MSTAEILPSSLMKVVCPSLYCTIENAACPFTIFTHSRAKLDTKAEVGWTVPALQILCKDTNQIWL